MRGSEGRAGLGVRALSWGLSLALALAPELVLAAPESVEPAPDPRATPASPATPEAGSVAEPPAPGVSELEPPPPSLAPPGAGAGEIELLPEPPGPAPRPEELEGELGSLTFPDPGVAPDDGMSMLVLSTATIGLTLAGVTAGLVIGLRQEVPLDWLLPSTLVPGVGLLAFGGGGLYLGVQRRSSYRRWAAGYRVIGTPQGKGLQVGASLTLLAALGLIPTGAYALSDGNLELGVPLLVIGGVAALATPTMFVVSAQRKRNYELTGGWRRRPVPPRPGQAGARIELQPSFAPLPRGGFQLGVSGRF